jgi:hypothetical protein
MMGDFLRKDIVVLERITQNKTSGKKTVSQAIPDIKAYVEWGKKVIGQKDGQDWIAECYLDIHPDTVIEEGDRITSITMSNGRVYNQNYYVKKVDFNTAINGPRQEVYI